MEMCLYILINLDIREKLLKNNSNITTSLKNKKKHLLLYC